MRQYLKIMKESTYNTKPTTPAASDVIWLDMAENDPQIDVVPSIWQIRGSMPKRGLTNRLMGSSQYGIQGSLQTYLYHEQADFWKAAVFEPTYNQTTNVPDLPSYTIQRAWVDNNNTVKVEEYNGCKFTGATLTGSNAGAQAPIQLSLNVVGSKYVENGSLTAPGCGDLPDDVHLWSGVDFLLGNTSLKAIVQNLTLSIQHNMNPVFHANKYADKIRYYGWNPSINATWDMDSHAYRNKFLDIIDSITSAQYATNNKVEFTYAADKKVTFSLYNVMFQNVTPARPPGGDFTESGTLMPNFDCTNLDMTCTVTNPAP